MKRVVAILIVFVLLLCACGKGASVTVAAPDYTAKELAMNVIEGINLTEEDFQYVNNNYDETALTKYVQGFYGLAPDILLDAAIYRSADPMKADEISIFKLRDKADLNTVFNELESYRHSRQGDFFGYNPEQASICDEAIISISTDGLWAAVLICPEPQKADEAFFGALNMELPEYEDEPFPNEEPEAEPVYIENLGELPEYWLPYTDPEIDDMTVWDNTAIVAAVKSGDDSALDSDGKKLYNKVNKVLDSIINSGMSDLKKEKAVYHWLTANCKYDYRHYDIPNAAPRESYEPYGAIVDGKAVCLGFATAFQLFMDILDIECITVVGAAFDSTEDHAWNMVKIDGEWYCVDATWDVGVEPKWFNYFNKSSERFALNGHQWDYEAYPIALPENIGKME